MGRSTTGIAQAKKDAFLAAYAAQGTLLGAAQTVGVSTSTHYDWLKRSKGYAEAFQAAEEKAIQRLEQEAIRRAVEGVEEAVYFNGQVIGTTRKKSDVLLIFLLKAKRPEVYRERLDARFQANLNVQSAVKVVHEYHELPAAIEASSIEALPNKALMAATAADTNDEDNP